MHQEPLHVTKRGASMPCIHAGHRLTLRTCLRVLQIAAGEVFGRDQPIALQLLGSENSKEALEVCGAQALGRWFSCWEMRSVLVEGRWRLQS